MNQLRVVVITGAAQGIGRRCAEVFAQAGYALALYDRLPLDTLLQDLPHGTDAIAFSGDVTDEAAIERCREATDRRWGHVDALVNNAGISLIQPAEDTTSDEFRTVLDVNLTGPFLLSRTFGIGMLRRGAGSIVNIASVAGLLGIADRAAYNASKHGLIGLTRTLAAEWGGRGVRVNAVCPGWVKTEMDVRDLASGAYTDADIEARVPMGRFASPDDIARAALYLADPTLSPFVNGVALSVDGGWAADGSWDSLRLRMR